MMDALFRHFARPARKLSALLCIVLAACGGGGGGGDRPVVDCSLAAQKAALSSYLDDRYYWYKGRPHPDPAAFPTLASFFEASLFDGGTIDGISYPADRYSFIQSSESFVLFFGEGRLLGYGLAVNGREVEDQPGLPLRVRYVEPNSPAATAGIVRGETIVSIDGRPPSDFIASGFSVLTPAAVGDVLNVVLRNAAGVERNVTLTARVFDLVPVPVARIVSTGSGTRIGYVLVKDFIEQALGPLESVFADFKAQRIRDVVLDLRYNGGGLIPVANWLASYAAGASAAGRIFTTLIHNDRHRNEDVSYRFESLASSLGSARVFVLSGSRTCSASELVVNGLEGAGVQVVQIGETTCGKPVGFEPVDNQCGTTFNVVNFESINARNEGRYFDGLLPNCPAGDDLDHALGDPSERLLAAARTFVDTGACPPVAIDRERPAAALRKRATTAREGGERSGMIAR